MKSRRRVNSDVGWLLLVEVPRLNVFHLIVLLAWLLFCPLALAALGEATPQDSPTNSDDKVYGTRDVDKKPVIDKERYDRNIPSAAGCDGHGLLIIRAVLRKSGKVSDIEIVQKAGCSNLERKAMKAVEIIKFKPAKKDGAFVSVRMEFQFKYDCDDMAGRRCK
jgi:TonB family protein